MTEFLNTAIVLKVQRLIMKTFEISEQEAHDHATELLTLAEGWGNPETAEQLDWSYRIKKDFGETNQLKWLSDAERSAFQLQDKDKYAAWDAFISSRRLG